MGSLDTDSERKNICVISNRLPISVKLLDNGNYDFDISSGGLVGALQNLSQFVQFKWYGWPGVDIPDAKKQFVTDELGKHHAVPIFFGKELADKHYNGFSNKILWPLLHYQINEICMSQPDWEAYQDVNRLFAEAIEEEISDNGIVWIQDYHLFLLPQMLRRELKERGKKNVKMGFFLHTVFPASDFFRILPVRRDIIASVLNCDVIGFHNVDYTAHFLDCCHKIMGLEVFDSQISYQGRAVRVITDPIGIEPGDFQAILRRQHVQDRVSSIREKYRDMKLLISVDRLDYIKGIPLRMEAMDTLLTGHPELIGKVVLLQILIPSREDVAGYQRLHSIISEKVTRINEKFGKIEFSPIQSMFNSVSKEELVALYSAADACVVSSTRDGLNIVSLEYIACQRKGHGVLLLSEFAGSAEYLVDAVKFNPWNAAEFADAIYEGLSMDKDEKARRSEGLRKYVTENTSQQWGERFICALTH